MDASGGIPGGTGASAPLSPPTGRAGSAAFEDPVLQAAYTHLALLAAAAPAVIRAFRAYTEERIGMFLPPDRAALISEVMLPLVGSGRTPAPAPPSRQDHQVYVTINLTEAIAALPDPVRSDLYGKISAFPWAAPWLALAHAFTGNTPPADGSPILEFSQYPAAPGRIGLRCLPGVLRAMKIGGHWFVRHDCPAGTDIRFSGLPWPAGHSQWFKENDHITVSGQSLDAATLELFSNHRGEPAGPLYLHASAGDIILSAEPSGSQGVLCWDGGWRLDGSPVLPHDISVIAGRSVPALRLIRAAIHGISRRWTLRLEDAMLRFPDGQSGLDGITLALEAGDMVAVMGPSGCGKSTLMSVLSGGLQLTSGSIRLDGTGTRKPSFALVPQDDVLFSELTAAENLRFAAALRSAGTPHPDAIPLTLAAVGLEAKGGLRVGSVTEKVLSGGERKRLNIGLELIGSPDALLLDEPTSGLSSADAGSVMKILRDRADQGVLVMAVIHQPSPEVFSKFDKVIVLDVGGRLAYFGTPEGTRSYFGVHASGSMRENWGPDGILETLVGRRTTLDGGALRRNFDPAFWKMRYASARAAYEPPLVSHAEAASRKEPPPAPVARPGFLKTGCVLLRREMLRRMRGWRAVAASCAIAVLLALIVAWVCRIISPAGTYSFTTNRHLPAFCFLNVILVQFLALSSSVQELVKDRAHRMRERLLRVPGAFWLIAKVPGLAIQTALQAALVVLAGGWVIGLGYGRVELWLALTLAGWASAALGLLVSALPRISERVALAAVPLLLVPQMILCGAQPFAFKDLSHLHAPFTPPAIHEGQPAPPPWIAQGMTSRWAYQACISGLRDHPAILAGDDLKPLFRTYNFARSLAPLWKSDPAEFLAALSGKTGRNLSEEQVRHEISLLVLNDKRSAAEVAESFGGLVPDTSRLRPIRNEFFLEYAASTFPERAGFAGKSMTATGQARLMLGILSVIFLSAAAAVMSLAPRRVADLTALIRRTKNPLP